MIFVLGINSFFQINDRLNATTIYEYGFTSGVHSILSMILFIYFAKKYNEYYKRNNGE